MKKMYFGHPINVYNTEFEKILLKKIKNVFPDWEIENPGEFHHGEEYKKWQEKTGRGMNYFFEVVLPKCQRGIFLPFRDGAWGIGVFGEAEFLDKNGCPIWQILPNGEISKINFADLKIFGKILNVEETRLRIRFPSGEIKLY